MPRSHGKVLSSVWRDPDWRDLTNDAQWLYVLLLSQPKLTLCGTLDVTTDRWARMAAGISREDVIKAMDELLNADYVLVDDVTNELAIRSFVKHDLSSSRMNVNLAKGFWRAWGGLESDYLRLAVVDLVPDEMWVEKLEEHAPDDAIDLRELADSQRAAGTTGRRERFT